MNNSIFSVFAKLLFSLVVTLSFGLTSPDTIAYEEMSVSREQQLSNLIEEQDGFKALIESDKEISQKQRERFWAVEDEFQILIKENPGDKTAYDAIVRHTLKGLHPIYKIDNQLYLQTFHLSNPQLVAVLTRATPAGLFTLETRNFYEAVIARSPHRDVRGVAMLSYAASLAGMADHIASINGLGNTVRQVIEKEATESVFENPDNRQEMSEKELQDAWDREVSKSPLIKWNGVSSKALLSRATELAAMAKADYGDIEIPQSSYIDGKLVLNNQDSHTVAEDSAALLTRLQTTALGLIAPQLTAIDTGGNPVALSTLRGKVIMLDFWATWCQPCIKAIPSNRELLVHHKGNGRPFELVTLSVDEELAEVVDFMAMTEMPFSNWYLGNEHPALSAWGITAYPTVILIDDQGVIRARPRGSHEELETYVDKLLTEAELRAAAK